MRKSIYLLVLMFVLLLAGSVAAQPRANRKLITDLRLKNGLRVLLLEDHSAPVVTIDVAYDVGSRNEIKGRTGFAHLFEHMMFKTVDGNTPDYYALDLLANILGGGQSSRLFQKVVKEKELVTGVSVGVREQRVASPLLIGTLVRPGKKVEDVEAAIYDEIVRLANEPVADWELEKAKNLTRRTYVRTMQSALNRALILGSNTVFYNDPNLTYTVMKKYDAVTKSDIQRVAKRYFQPNSRTVVITLVNHG